MLKKNNRESSRAFVKKFMLPPYQSGRLDSLLFAVKDCIDIADEITGWGSPVWADTHPKAAVHAVCVEQLLAEGATCVGKTITDELTYSLLGENPFYGTPSNPKAPQHVPGGSSSGSASAVACGEVDFALGTDTGGSVRVPASYSGIWGYRPSHGHISVAGVIPFAPSLDTVGVLAKDHTTLARVAAALLAVPEKTPLPPNPTLFFLEDLFELADAKVQQALIPVVTRLQQTMPSHTTNLSQLLKAPIQYPELLQVYSLLQHAEIWSNVGHWVSTHFDDLSSMAQRNVNLARQVDRSTVQASIIQRTSFAQQLNEFLTPGKWLCFPTTPTLAPLLSSITQERAASVYYARTLTVNAIAGLSRAPQITWPAASIEGVPVGLSVLAGYGQDSTLWALCEALVR
ncbi:MAG: hypothetical protein A3F41_00035 [Coxiella sp. RIFCSPHIGHO2_12_FULL_44_14]|nr:MAG: hypothetical protein A3F41_00035 [Coxiella sp. RIFCSPHIGHO2_12_FULL_44_14]